MGIISMDFCKKLFVIDINSIHLHLMVCFHLTQLTLSTFHALYSYAFFSYRDDRRWTPLLYVATAGCPECTRVLVENGAKLNEWDKNRVRRNAFLIKKTFQLF